MKYIETIEREFLSKITTKQNRKNNIMAKYKVNYSCGHGSITKELFGKNSERERKIEWMESTFVCPDCYKKDRAEADAAAPKIAALALVPGLGVTIQVVASGQIEANKTALTESGFSWQDKASGMMGYFSLSKPERVLAIHRTFENLAEMQEWVAKTGEIVIALGYELKNNLGPIDTAWISEEFAKKAEKAKAIENDPKPAPSPLRKRIMTLEKSSGREWNGKIYGKKGGYNFYVNNEKHECTDAEVAERETINKEIAAWYDRNK